MKNYQMLIDAIAGEVRASKRVTGTSFNETIPRAEREAARFALRASRRLPWQIPRDRGSVLPSSAGAAPEMEPLGEPHPQRPTL